MRTSALVTLQTLLAVVLTGAGCSSLPTKDRYRSSVQLLKFTGCQPFDALKTFESALFAVGFTREPMADRPNPFELYEHYITHEPKLVTFVKSDFERRSDDVSEPYRELPAEYKVATCDETGGVLYLVVVRHDPSREDKFLGSRFSEALDRTGCVVSPEGAPRDLGFFEDSTAEDLYRHITRGKCRDYAHDTRPL